MRSEAYATDGSQQVGAARFRFQCDHAGFWSGTAASWVDLHAFLPSVFIQSGADAIWTNGGYTYVAGSAWFETDFNHRSILRVQPVPEPTSFGLFALTAVPLALTPARRLHHGCRSRPGGWAWAV